MTLTLEEYWKLRMSSTLVVMCAWLLLSISYLMPTHFLRVGVGLMAVTLGLGALIGHILLALFKRQLVTPPPKPALRCTDCAAELIDITGTRRQERANLVQERAELIGANRAMKRELSVVKKELSRVEEILYGAGIRSWEIKKVYESYSHRRKSPF